MPSSVKMSLLLLPLLAACTEKETLRYGLQDQVVYEDKTQKTKRKSESEYISILYTNLYQQPITPNQLYKTQQVVQSIGDRTLAWEMLLSNYFNKPGIQMPDETFMRAETDFGAACTSRRVTASVSSGSTRSISSAAARSVSVSIRSGASSRAWRAARRSNGLSCSW